MKLWQVVSVLREEPALCNKVLANYGLSSQSIDPTHHRTLLNTYLTSGIVREWLKPSKQKLFYHKTKGVLQTKASKSEQVRELTLLKAFEIFGGDAIENAFEYGQVHVTPQTKGGKPIFRKIRLSMKKQEKTIGAEKHIILATANRVKTNRTTSQAD